MRNGPHTNTQMYTSITKTDRHTIYEWIHEYIFFPGKILKSRTIIPLLQAINYRHMLLPSSKADTFH